MQITIEDYVPDGPGAKGRVELVLPPQQLRLIVGGTEGRFTLPCDLPEIVDTRPMGENDRRWIWNCLTSDDREYIESPDYIDNRRGVVLTDARGDTGFVLLMGEASIFTMRLAGRTLCCDGQKIVVASSVPHGPSGPDRSAGETALRRLFDVAHRESGQCRFIARFLLGLYNGERFPFDLTNLRCIDQSLLDDCMAVLAMDSQPKQEVHLYFENGGARFEALAEQWGVLDVRSLRSEAQKAGIAARGL